MVTLSNFVTKSDHLYSMLQWESHYRIHYKRASIAYSMPWMCLWMLIRAPKRSILFTLERENDIIFNDFDRFLCHFPLHRERKSSIFSSFGPPFSMILTLNPITCVFSCFLVFRSFFRRNVRFWSENPNPSGKSQY